MDGSPVRGLRKKQDIWGCDRRVYNQASVFFFTNFPDDWSHESMWLTFRKFGRVLAIYCPPRKSKSGRRFGFVRFLEVKNEVELERKLDQIRVGTSKLWVNRPRFRMEEGRNRGDTKPAEMNLVKPGRSFAEVVKGNQGVEDNKGSNLQQWFEEVKPWSPSSVAKERFVWIRCQGVPIHAWGLEFFSSIGAVWGKVISLDDSTSKKIRFDIGRFLISTPIMEFISKSMTITVNGMPYTVKVMEEEATNGIFSMKSDHVFRELSASDDHSSESWSLNSDGEDGYAESIHGGGVSREYGRSSAGRDDDDDMAKADDGIEGHGRGQAESWMESFNVDITARRKKFEFEDDIDRMMSADGSNTQAEKFFEASVGKSQKSPISKSEEMTEGAIEEKWGKGCKLEPQAGLRDDEDWASYLGPNKGYKSYVAGVDVEISETEKDKIEEDEVKRRSRGSLMAEEVEVNRRSRGSWIPEDDVEKLTSRGSLVHAEDEANRRNWEILINEEDEEIWKSRGSLRHEEEEANRICKGSLMHVEGEAKSRLRGSVMFEKDEGKQRSRGRLLSEEDEGFESESGQLKAWMGRNERKIKKLKKKKTRSCSSVYKNSRIVVQPRTEKLQSRQKKHQDLEEKTPAFCPGVVGHGKRVGVRDLVIREKVEFLSIQESKTEAVDHQLCRALWGSEDFDWVAQPSKDWGPKPFRFFDAWLELPQFKGIVIDIWNSTVVKGWNGYRLKEKLKETKKVLKEWSKNMTSEIDLGIQKSIDSIASIDKKGEEMPLLLEDIEARRTNFLELWKNQRMKEKVHSMKDGVANYFETLFKEDVWQRPVLDGVEFKKISDEERAMLEAPFSEEEVRRVVWSCESTKAPGPDGFNFKFVKEMWGTLKDDVMGYVSDFHKPGKLVRGMNCSFIVLIPKVNSPQKIEEFRPISFVGVMYKLIAKLLARRLASVLNGIIGENQMAFISTAEVSVLINGSTTRQFKMQRVLRQGDPLSPLLFFIVAEGLNGIISLAASLGLVNGIEIGQCGMNVTYLQFADDTIVFGNASEENIWAVKSIMRIFEMVSGLKINFGKSMLMGINVPEEWMTRMSCILNCKQGSLPCKYLGMPIGSKRKCIAMWRPMIDSFKKKLANWKNRFISLGGRITLLNSVLSSLPVFMMSVHLLPKGLILILDKICRNFLWGGGENNRKINWVCWVNVCRSKLDGGLGVKDLRKFNLVLLGKWWSILAEGEEGLLYKVIREKYGSNGGNWLNWIE
ncbi:hypothetical protein SLEP1_g11532 [Rubroshorea leprosula]|nr:hypothetical protein SLEP1_g11532 [Rubroshorea leprosula]